MVPLFERGREALIAYVATLGPTHRPAIGSHTIDVVTHADFVAHAELVLRHVIHNGQPTHILCEGGALCAVIEQRLGNW